MHLPPSPIDSDPMLVRFFLPYQIHWIQAEDYFHSRGLQAFALAEKSVRIGWTFADAFKNVRKRLRFPKRDYLFATKDYPSALEYMRLCYGFADLLDFTRAILSHGEEYLQIPRIDPDGKTTGFTDEIKIGLIKFDNGSRIIAFSSNPRAMAVHAGDVGLDEFAKHPNARLLWETAQGRVTWGYDMAVWSAHDGEDTLFNQFAQEARAHSPQFLIPSSLSSPSPSIPSDSPSSTLHSQSSSSASPPPAPGVVSSDTQAAPVLAPEIENQKSKFEYPHSPWNLYYRVTITDAIQSGLLDVINRVQKTKFSPQQFVSDCRARARDEEVFEQSYMCNPLGAAANRIVEWSAIERCRADYQIERVNLEADQVRQRFGEFNPSREHDREYQIQQFLRSSFPSLFPSSSSSHSSSSSIPSARAKYRVGFDVAASGQGDLASFYIDEAKAQELWLRALLTCRTEDWHFLKTVLFYFLQKLPNVQAAGDESGLGRQICWEAAQKYSSRFMKVNFAAKKHDLGFALMNQLSVAEKRFPKSEADIAADYFALRKTHNGAKWAFSEGRNLLNPASHCDIAWAGALATHAHTERRCTIGCALLLEDGTILHSGHPQPDLSAEEQEQRRVSRLINSNDPRIWKPLNF